MLSITCLDPASTLSNPAGQTKLRDRRSQEAVFTHDCALTRNFREILPLREKSVDK